MVWKVNNINRDLTAQPPIIWTKTYPLHGPRRPIPPWLAKAFASYSWPARCSDSSAGFAERRNRGKRRLEAHKRKVYGRSHTLSQHLSSILWSYCRCAQQKYVRPEVYRAHGAVHPSGSHPCTDVTFPPHYPFGISSHEFAKAPAPSAGAIQPPWFVLSEIPPKCLPVAFLASP